MTGLTPRSRTGIENPLAGLWVQKTSDQLRRAVLNAGDTLGKAGQRSHIDRSTEHDTVL